MLANWKCSVGWSLWGLAALAVVLALVAVFMRDLVFGLEPLAWYWNALVLGVLAQPMLKRCSCGSCATQ